MTDAAAPPPPPTPEQLASFQQALQGRLADGRISALVAGRVLEVLYKKTGGDAAFAHGVLAEDLPLPDAKRRLLWQALQVALGTAQRLCRASPIFYGVRCSWGLLWRSLCASCVGSSSAPPPAAGVCAVRVASFARRSFHSAVRV